jgi:hypothetical protein
MITTLPITSGFYVADSLPVSAQQCRNWYPAVAEMGGMTSEVLYGTPGISSVVSASALPTFACRGAHAFESAPYFVLGGTLYRLESDETLTSCGSISGSGRVWIADNGTQMLILAPGGDGYIFTTGPDTLTTISDVDFTANGDPQAVVFIDGYFCLTTDEKKFIVSALNDGTTYSALDFGSAESSPDGVVAPFVYKNQLFIAGTETIEGFNNIGGAEFPFERSGLFFDQGVDAAFSLVSTPDMVLFVGSGANERPSIWGLAGNTAQRVSTQAIDAILERLTPAELSSVFAWQYAQSGHYFVGFNLPDTTLVYDITTGKWHERISRVTGVDDVIDDKRCRINAVVSAYGALYVGDSEDGRIGSLDIDTYQEYDENIYRTVSTMPFQNNQQPFTVPMLELTCESGVGNDLLRDPMIRLDVSRDGGQTFSDERSRSLGKKGEYQRRAIWRRLGRSERFDVYRFTLDEPVKPVVIQLTADIRG